MTHNNATRGGGIFTVQSSLTSIDNSTFTGNSAVEAAGVLSTEGSSIITITSSSFTNNTSDDFGGVMHSVGKSSLNITWSMFTGNRANLGGVLQWIEGSCYISDSIFRVNIGVYYGGVMITSDVNLLISNSTFDHNLGSLYTLNSNLTFSGYTNISNNKEELLYQNGFANYESGAITSIQSTVIFTGVTILLNNQARHGGAIQARESTVVMYGKTVIAKNVATDRRGGGGIYLRLSNLEIKGSCNISNNNATTGGGIHASSSIITVHQLGALQLINNSAKLGGGLYLEVNPKVYLLNTFHYVDKNLLIFTSNTADYGGAVYVADDTNNCASWMECFFQAVAVHIFQIKRVEESIIFSENGAVEQGANLYGGLLDRCIPSSSAVVTKTRETTHYNGVTYLGNISNIELDSIASSPVHICFCNSQGQQDCSYQPPPVVVKKGETFTVSLVAVDQINNSISTNIISSLGSSKGGLGEDQHSQRIGRNCTNLKFNVFSPHDSETIILYADGPCGSAPASIRHVNVTFLNCTCPIGFEPSNRRQTRCECDCDSAMSPYITNCNYTAKSLLRVNTNSWITYMNNTDSSGYVISPFCPYDYCHSPTKNVSINLNLPNGADTQCVYNRTGILCGACRQALSLSLGSSDCLPCQKHWPAVFIAITIAALIAGILLVTVMLVLNMTVANGLINGVIFYANIMSANSAIFFPSSEPSFPTVFVAWLNLDIGIDVCFINGLDAYTKTWFQLAFPVYIISLVVVLIVIIEHSHRFAGLVGKRDPIATLATLILLSYAKLLSVTITALSFAVLRFPDGSQEMVWLPDGNVKYLQGKHVPLVIIALLIILIGAPYTILLFLWQWLVRAPKWKIFKWTRNTKLNALITTYHVPYNSKYRFWTGLLLIVRVILYITASVTVSTNPHTSLLVTIILVVGLFLLSRSIGSRVYKKSSIDIVDTLLYFNVIAVAALSWYNFKSDITMQTAVAYTSTVITSILFIGMIIYHVTLMIKKIKTTTEKNEYPLVTVRSESDATSEVTRSIVVIPKPHTSPPETTGLSDQSEIIIGEERLTETLYIPYSSAQQ